MSDAPGRDERETASRRFLAYVLLPAWMIAGFADYLCHRRTKIECTSGTHESLTHLLMAAAAGPGVMAPVLFEMNASVLAIMAGSALAHEAIVLWDVGYAAGLRPPPATEQHVHSFLEVLPFAGLALAACMHSGAAAAAIEKRAPFPRLERNRGPAALLRAAAVAAAATLLVVVPHAEEFLRCFRVNRTLLPHRVPIDQPNG